jgi:hypothetical protein
MLADYYWGLVRNRSTGKYTRPKKMKWVLNEKFIL